MIFAVQSRGFMPKTAEPPFSQALKAITYTTDSTVVRNEIPRTLRYEIPRDLGTSYGG